MRKKTSLILLTSATMLGLAVGFDKVSANAVNDYVIAKGWSPSNNTMAISDALPKYAYRNGVAKPEGVIVHETGNPSDKLSSNAIWNEITYMLNNYNSAFVHSFVDGDNRIEIANSDYLAWGAGPSGNARYIQTEQVQVNNKDAFAGELYNLATMQARYLIKYNLKPELGKTVFSHAMISSMFPQDTDHSDPTGYWADMAAHFYGTTYTMNDYEWLLEQVYNQMAKPVAPAKYKVGDKVQIASFALTEANGYDLTNRQNWIGTIKSVKANAQSGSNYEYYIDYGNGVRSEHVLEQDLKAALAAKYKVGDLLKVADFAVSEANGYDLTNHRGWTGTVKSVEINNASGSHYAYHIVYGDDSRNEHVLEQDVSPSSDYKYKVGQTVQVVSTANAGTDGEDISKKRSWIGTITKVMVKAKYDSKFQYSVTFPGGTNSQAILEQDLKQAPTPKYSTGQKVQIVSTANAESNGYNLVPNRGKVGTIKSVAVMNQHNSHFEYYIDYGDGTRSEHVIEQDLQQAPTPKYSVGQKVQIASTANVESNGYNLVPNRGKVGTIKSVAVMNQYSSHYEYYVDYGDGTGNMHVIEQDLKEAPTPKYSVGQKVQIVSTANAESNGYNLVPNRGKVGTIKSVAVMNQYSSHYEYYIDYGDGTRSEHVIEQDLKDAPLPKYSIGQKVQIVSTANAESNGYNLVPNRGKVGTIKSVAVMNQYSSHYEYYVDYGDGTVSVHVIEQDLTLPKEH